MGADCIPPPPLERVNESSVCAAEYVEPIVHPASEEEVALAQQLFSQNGISLDNLRINRVIQDEFGTNFQCDQFFQSILILYGDSIYSFNPAGELKFCSGEPVQNLSLSTTPRVCREDAAAVAVEAPAQMGSLAGNDWLEYLGWTTQDCFTATLVLWWTCPNRNPCGTDYVLSWWIRNSNRDEYPYAVINAEDGRLLFYDDGIRTAVP